MFVISRRRAIAALTTASLLCATSAAADAAARPTHANAHANPHAGGTSPHHSARASKRTAPKVTSAQKSEVRRFRRNFEAGGVVAGPIVHFTAQHTALGATTPTQIEGWLEQGGADRYRYIQTFPVTANDASSGGRQIVWGRGNFWAVTDVMRAGDGVKQVTNIGATDPAHSYDSFLYGLRHIADAQTSFGAAPAGPTIGGAATRAATIALPFATPNATEALTVYLNASTQLPVRMTYKLGYPDAPLFADDTFAFSLWQTMPKTTSVDVLGGAVPLDATIQTTES
jgi:hypothetical protein